MYINQVFQAINNLPEEQAQEIDFETLMKNAVALTRAVAYKKKIDIDTQSVLERRSGNWQIYEKIIFTQYVFIRSEITEENYYRIKKIAGVVRFLGYENGIIPTLNNSEQRYIEWLWNARKPIEPSKIYVTPSGDKMIMSGILRKYSGNEIEYNLRQRKANIFIEIAGRKHKITLPVIRI